MGRGEGGGTTGLAAGENHFCGLVHHDYLECCFACLKILNLRL